MWPDFHKTRHTWHCMHATVKEIFLYQFDTSTNKLTNIHNTTAKSLLVNFCWGLFLRPVRRPRVHVGCPLTVTSWLVQVAFLLEIVIWLVNHIGHGFSYVLWHSECNRISIWAISPWKWLCSTIIHHFVAGSALPQPFYQPSCSKQFLMTYHANGGLLMNQIRFVKFNLAVAIHHEVYLMLISALY